MTASPLRMIVTPFPPTTVEEANAFVARFAAEDVRGFVADIAALRVKALRLAGADAAQPVGVREAARRLAMDLQGHGDTVAAVLGRAAR